MKIVRTFNIQCMVVFILPFPSTAKLFSEWFIVIIFISKIVSNNNDCHFSIIEKVVGFGKKCIVTVANEKMKEERRAIIVYRSPLLRLASESSSTLFQPP